MVSIQTKNEIMVHLKLSSKLHIAAKEVLENGDLSISDVATKYGLNHYLLFRKVFIMKRKEEFYDKKRKLDKARKEIIARRSTCNAASKYYGFSAVTLQNEVVKASAQKNYECDRKINNNGIGFTYLQEESLLKILKDWARSESSQGRCSCTFCALEKLSTLAYEFALENNIKYPLWDYTRQASINWLIDFEMRHTDEINNSFYPFMNVLKQIFGPTYADE